MEGARLDALDGAMRRFAEAWARGDAATLETLLSPRYTHGDIYGRFMDRTAWLDYVRTRGGRATRIGVRDVQTRLVGDVAIVTGVNDVHDLAEPERTARQHVTLRFTQVWAWRDGRWWREAFQATITDAA